MAARRGRKGSGPACGPGRRQGPVPSAFPVGSVGAGPSGPPCTASQSVSSSGATQATRWRHPRLYAGLAPALQKAAGLSVFAHLEDLVGRGLVETDGPPALDGAYRPGRMDRSDA